MLDLRQYARARELWARGVGLSDIAADLGVPEHAVMNCAATHRKDFPRRKEHAVVTKERLRLMRSLRDEGMSYRLIADAIGCDARTVARWLD